MLEFRVAGSPREGDNVPDVGDPGDKHQHALKQLLYLGASTANPIDILATGTATQLEQVMTYCEEDLEDIDAMIVIFGSPGLGSVKEAYQVIQNMHQTCRKPIFPIFPSVVNVKDEINQFIQEGFMAFSDEYVFAKSLAKIMGNTTPSIEPYTIPDNNDAAIPRKRMVTTMVMTRQQQRGQRGGGSGQ